VVVLTTMMWHRHGCWRAGWVAGVGWVGCGSVVAGVVTAGAGLTRAGTR